MTKIYTIGYGPWYDKWMVEQGEDFKKRGQLGQCPGGSAYIGLESAQKALNSLLTTGYKIYILDTDETNLYLHNGNFHIEQSCRILPFDNESELVKTNGRVNYL